MENNIFKNVRNSWIEVFEKLDIKDKISKIISNAYSEENVLPNLEDTLRIFSLINPEDIRVVIIGQDPYHTKGVADGIAFSTRKEKTPPSLKNIFKELFSDTGIIKNNNDLSEWVSQGVLLINPVWSVREGKPNSHKDLGYVELTTTILEHLNKRNSKLIYCLWGNSAKYLYNNLRNKTEYVLEAAHPSPFSCYRGFFGSKHFSKINEIIQKNNFGNTIEW